jgi:NADH:ubiquinone oxidoreductase subunit E
MKSILVCTNLRHESSGDSCAARGSCELKTQLQQEIEQQQVQIAVKEIQCLGECETGPNLRLIPNGKVYRHVTTESLISIVKDAKKFIAE